MRQFVLSLLLVLATASTRTAPDFVTPKADVTTHVVVRASASSDSAPVANLAAGTQAELLGAVPNWYHVRLSNGVEGYVSKRWTRIVGVAQPVAGGASFTVDVVDVGTGLGVLVRGPDFALMYDAGSNDDLARGPSNRMVAFVKAAAPNLTTLDHVILSHPHRDHVELLPDVMAQYQVKQVWDSGRFYDNCGYRLFLAAVRDEPGVQYHTAMQDMGTRDFPFPAGSCYNSPVAAETIHVPHSTRIAVGTPIALGQGASMTILRADGASYPSPNDNSLVVRLDLGDTRVLLVGDSEAGGRQDPSVPPSPSSPEGLLLACCHQALAADVLIEAHHGSKTSSRKAFLDAVMASVYVVSSGPTKYGQVTLPDHEVIDELVARGKLLRTDLNDVACKTSTTKIGPKADGEPGGCDNVRVTIPASGPLKAEYYHGG